MNETDRTFDDYRACVERTLDEVLPRAETRPADLAQSMRYAVGTRGKRIRPCLCLASAVAAGGSAADARYPAAAIEILHNYTLVHDDLPAMDDDELRRGEPSVWKKFGEANAILCGDALQALAFRVAARAPRNVAAIVDVLGERGLGVVRGQVEDLVGQLSPAVRDAAWVDFVYAHKTADLFVAAAAMGALAAGGDEVAVAHLRDYAFHLGLAFQYEDDLLDDDSPFSRDETEARVRTATNAAVASLQDLPGDVAPLKSLAERLVGRTV